MKREVNVTCSEPAFSNKWKIDLESEVFHLQIHLLDVSCILLSTYAFSESVSRAHRILSRRHCSLRSVLTVSIFLRETVDVFLLRNM